MAPEQLLGQPIDQRVDLDAAAVVPHEVSDRGPPHEADSAIALVGVKLAQDPLPPTKCRPTCRSSFRAWSPARWPAIATSVPPAPGSCTTSWSTPERDRHQGPAEPAQQLVIVPIRTTSKSRPYTLWARS